MNPQVPEVSIVVPVHRTADTLRELHRRLRNVQPEGRPYEIICVDDACPHGSLAVLADLARDDPWIVVVPLQRNVGQNRAVLIGLRRAQGRRVVVMDSDLQDPPEIVPDLLANIEDGSTAAVFAGRAGRYESSLRLLTSRVFKRVLHYLCGTPVDAGLFVAMTRETVDQLLRIPHPAPSVVAMIGCTASPLASIPVVRGPRPSGRSAYSAWARLRLSVSTLAWVLAWKWRRRRATAGQLAEGDAA